MRHQNRTLSSLARLMSTTVNIIESLVSKKRNDMHTEEDTVRFDQIFFRTVVSTED